MSEYPLRIGEMGTQSGELSTIRPMNVCFTIRHPARVHLYKNPIRILAENGHNVYTFVVRSDIITELLDNYGMDYRVLANDSSSLPGLFFEQAKVETKLLVKSLAIHPDVMVDGVASTHVAKLVGAKSVLFSDTGHAKNTHKLQFPFADRICTPERYHGEIGEKRVTHRSYHELAYLHPNRFEPDPSVLDDTGLDPDDRFVILRTVGWDALHDIGKSGFDSLMDVIEALEETGVEVLITSEAPLPESAERYRLSIEPHRIHHLMYYADLFIGESGTMASESAVLGTPAVYVSSIRLGYLDELEDRYGLVFNYSGPDRQRNGLEKAVSILEDYDEREWARRRETMLDEKVDMTDVILDQITDLFGDG